MMTLKAHVFPLFAALMLGACVSADAGAPADVRYETAGDRVPTIVFEAGLGDGAGTWSGLSGKLSGSYRVFTYDRPRYGAWTSDSDGKRTGDEVAQHLHDTLRDAGVPPPYVLVGHSIGGLYSLAFARLYPDEVVGVVLVDARLPGFTVACEAADGGLCDIPEMMKKMLPQPQKAEALGMVDSSAFAGGGQYGPWPVTVIAATKAPSGASKRFRQVWLETARQFAADVPNGRYIEATRSSHYVHHNRPKLVEAEIRRVAGAGSK